MPNYHFKVICGGYRTSTGVMLNRGDTFYSTKRLDKQFANAFELLNDTPAPEEHQVAPMPLPFRLERCKSGRFNLINEFTGKPINNRLLTEAQARSITEHDWKQWWFSVKMWNASTAYILGGGPSLKDMDLSPLHDRRVIGVNDAYMLGAWVDVCFFGDFHWLVSHEASLRGWPGLKVTNHANVLGTEGVHVMKRVPRGLGRTDRDLGWHSNSGTAAILLAVKLGAQRIVLLGFDGKLGEKGQSNWHPNNLNSNTPRTYRVFEYQHELAYKILQAEKPKVRIYNATPGTALEVFPKITWKEALKWKK